MKKFYPYDPNVSSKYRIHKFDKQIDKLKETIFKKSTSNKKMGLLLEEYNQLTLLERRDEENKAIEKGI